MLDGIVRKPNPRSANASLLLTERGLTAGNSNDSPVESRELEEPSVEQQNNQIPSSSLSGNLNASSLRKLSLLRIHCQQGLTMLSIKFVRQIVGTTYHVGRIIYTAKMHSSLS